VLTASLRSFQKVGVVAADIVRPNLFERYVDMPLKNFNSFGVRVNRRSGVIVANELPSFAG
jgi:hypothetical protein